MDSETWAMALLITIVCGAGAFIALLRAWAGLAAILGFFALGGALVVVWGILAGLFSAIS
ncbi:hypothetical protein ABI214_24120 [Prescottella soli]|uniref:Uncharacterized protein n=1 Tax=Prescottella soli TaxID=1543852 RepID=A0ABW9FT57_9NOCA